MSKAKVLGMPASSNSMGATLAALHIMGDKVEFEVCNLMEGAHQTPEFGEINPFRQIPSFVDADGTGMGETNAIIMYIAAKYGPEFLAVEKGPTAIWALESCLGAIYSGGWSDICYPCFGFFPAPADDNYDKPKEKLSKNLTTFAATFLPEGNTFIGGDTLCVADFRLAPLVEALIHEHVKKTTGFECPERFAVWLAEFKKACPSAAMLESAGGFSIKEWLDTKM